jgi:lysophospholipase L1-like esterase
LLLALSSACAPLGPTRSDIAAPARAATPAQPTQGVAARDAAEASDEAQPAIAADAGAQATTSEVPLVSATPIQDPSGHALAGFHAALTRAAQGEGQARAVFYGASHVASDLYTDVLRSRLQARFGDAGSGFVLPAQPFPAYRNAGVAYDEQHGFRGVHVKAKAPRAARYGLAGAYLVTRPGKRAAARLATRARPGSTGAASRIELYYAKTPGGGKLRFGVDGALRTVGADARHFEPAYLSLEASDAPHRIDLIVDSPVALQIFGLSLERAGSGVLLDTLGIPGSRAAYHLLWDDALYREHLARRRPDLIAFAYGTNESGDDDASIASYEAQLDRVIARAREIAPNASCLLIGPSDRPVKDDDGTFTARPRQALVIDAQRRVAFAHGCGFFDVVALMGGPLGMLRWTAALPPLATRDYVHFTRLGYEELGRVLHDALVAGYVDPPAEAATVPSVLLSDAPGSPQSP